MKENRCFIILLLMVFGVMPVLNQAAFAFPADLAERVERTIDLPHAGVERMIWSDDGNKIAVLEAHGAYVVDAHDGRLILKIWGGGDDDEGRLGSESSMFAFTADGSELIAPLHTGGKQEVVWQQGVESQGAYLFTAVNVSSGSSRYVFSDPIYKSSAGNGDVARDGSLLIVQIGLSGYFGVYQADRPSRAIRYLGVGACNHRSSCSQTERILAQIS